MKLNQRQESIYSYIKEFKKDKQYSPTVREIQKALNIKSVSTVHTDLSKLEDAGLISRSNNISRSIELTDRSFIEEPLNESTIEVPVLGRVAAGEPIYADSNIESYFPIPADYSKKGDLFMLTIRGESMIEAGILDGDKVLVRKQDICENGEIIVALIEDGATVKRFSKEGGLVQLLPENSSMSPIIPESLTILGKVIALFRDDIS